MSLQLQFELDQLNQAYGDALDSGRLSEWASMFMPDGRYRAQGRENFDRDLPLAAMFCDGSAMFLDRVLVIEKVMVFAPRQIRHVISPMRLVSREGSAIVARSSFCVFHTLPHQPTELLSVGRYEDRVERDADGVLRFRERSAIYDTLLIPNSLVYPL